MNAALGPSDIVTATLALIAVMVSLATFALNYRHERRSALLARKPVVVFVYAGKVGWTARNVGNGPALNVVIALRERSREWSKPVRVPPLARDGKIVLDWLGHVNTASLAATYTDTENTPYTTTCSDDLNRPFEGMLVGPWPEDKVIPWWKAHLP